MTRAEACMYTPNKYGLMVNRYGQHSHCEEFIPLDELDMYLKHREAKNG